MINFLLKSYFLTKIDLKRYFFVKNSIFIVFIVFFFEKITYKLKISMKNSVLLVYY